MIAPAFNLSNFTKTSFVEKIKVSIIEDNRGIRENVTKFIGFHEEFELGAIYESANTFIDAFIHENPGQTHILQLDIGLPGIS